MQKLLEIGLSGWLIFLITILIGGGLGFRLISRRRSRQSNIRAAGDVAGGDIFKGKKCEQKNPSSLSEVDSVQNNIVSGGDVAGGNIDKRSR